MSANKTTMICLGFIIKTKKTYSLSKHSVSLAATTNSKTSVKQSALFGNTKHKQKEDLEFSSLWYLVSALIFILINVRDVQVINVPIKSLVGQLGVAGCGRSFLTRVLRNICTVS